MPVKNEIIPLLIEDMTETGDGVGKYEGQVFFVPGCVVGDEIEARVLKVKSSHGYGRAERVVTPSPDRVEPRCPIAAPCGGCQLQSLSYPAQLRFKERRVQENLRRIGGCVDFELRPIVGMSEPWCYRNKAQFAIAPGKDGRPVGGYYARRSHDIIPVKSCALGPAESADALSRLLAHMERFRIPAYDEATGKGLVRHLLVRRARATGQVMVCVVVNGGGIPHGEELAASLREIPGVVSVLLSVNRARTNVILGETIISLYGEKYITERIGHLAFRVSPLSFFQVNPAQTEKLYQLALEAAGLSGRETVWDLYCGAGTVSLFLAQKAKLVYGVELSASAVEDARVNARINGVENVEFIRGLAEEAAPALLREPGGHPDVIVVDPPRKGCAPALLETVLSLAPAKLVYVSCDPGTLARDSAILRTGGYSLLTAQPVDMFPMTVGVETVALFSRLRA